MSTDQSPRQDDESLGGDLGDTGGTAGALGGGSELAASGGVTSDTAAATAGVDPSAYGISAGENPDEDSSYPSGMFGSTNSTGHTIGEGTGNTGSNADHIIRDEDSSGT